MITYRKTPVYKYQLVKDFKIKMPNAPPREIKSEFIVFEDFDLIIKAGYTWDGASGPTLDTKTSMRGSLIHDALYQLIREEKLERDHWKDFADRFFRDTCIKDGMAPWRANAWYWAVKNFGASSTRKKDVPIQTAP